MLVSPAEKRDGPAPKVRPAGMRAGCHRARAPLGELTWLRAVRCYARAQERLLMLASCVRLFRSFFNSRYPVAAADLRDVRARVLLPRTEACRL